ncbi:hypothetical protein [Caballeronia arationis]|uniref:hypothetical protein n=1 Tax=Caballeronia arationis TaxID=1777142 RepID=UPI0011981DA0|nr:hypothetical protein [Caballeronia arationis]
MRRIVGTTRGNVPAVDPYIITELDLLDELLARKVFEPAWKHGNVSISTPGKTAAAKRGVPKVVATATMLRSLLVRPLAPRKAPEEKWTGDSLPGTLAHMPPNDDYLSLSELVDATAGLSALKYAFKNDIATKLYTLDFGERTVLGGYPAVTDFLVAYAFHVMGLTEVDAARNFITSSPAGVSKVVKYLAVSGARAYLETARLEVPGLDNDNGPVIQSLADAALSLEAGSFAPSVAAVVQAPVFNRAESKLIKHAEDSGLGPILPEMKPILIRYIQASNAARIPITNANIVYYASGWIQQISRSLQIGEPESTSTDPTDSDFDITPFDDDRSQIQISRSAVKCASQLFYGMVLGEELQVFDAMNFFTHKYLVRGSLTIEDSRLRDDLQSYVFSNRFTDPRGNRVLDRTRPAERAMFYRQVFNYGTSQTGDDMVQNQEFPRLWKVLMLESAKFLERAQISPNPDNYVSRQNVLQSVEDLQYNLSTNCTGMSNVIAPLINAELEFVIKRIFMHPEVLRQVVPSGGTWWRVVETLILAMTGGRPKATVIYNKAKGGNDIIRAIADYDPTVFAQDQKFAEFIGNVERFITTQSILQDALTDDLVRSGASGDAASQTPASTAPQATPEAASAATDPEWNF